ncbi:hypothetical protein TD95_004262 [Thielaviopsis punctulata]|uniref:nicotinamidase n=1 Tax=Thielaviopsis punctulata TaxID=72032 RepID=A0A0F4Z8W8_9PEZI|nr:hypothetical protein TD95_004262 [Thielaviopsis punctulata]
MAFTPALIVVDFQEDFCPPNGSLAVPNGRAITSTVNTLLSFPFPLKLATMDWHPPNHISFAANHPGCTPFVDSTLITNPFNPQESYSSRLWPVHCLQDSPGARLVPELHSAQFHAIVKKGSRPDVEMYSAFYAPFKTARVADSGLAEQLRANNITHVYVVGLAADYCVKATALDSMREGFVTYIVEEGTKPVDAEQWPEVRRQIVESGVQIISFDSPEVSRLRQI